MLYLLSRSSVPPRGSADPRSARASGAAASVRKLPVIPISPRSSVRREQAGGTGARKRQSDGHREREAVPCAKGECFPRGSVENGIPSAGIRRNNPGIRQANKVLYPLSFKKAGTYCGRVNGLSGSPTGCPAPTGRCAFEKRLPPVRRRLMNSMVTLQSVRRATNNLIF